MTGWRLTPQEQRDVDGALLAYWTARDEAQLAQQRAGRLDVGGRAGVTSGGHLDRVAQLFARVCVDVGVPRQEIWYKAPAGDAWKRPGVARGFTLPGYFRPSKQWDLVVWFKGDPIVAIELKSQNGPSYGNNANNRAEEAIGNAVDLHRAKAAGLLPSFLWTGYVFIIQQDDASTSDRGARDSMFLRPDPRFQSWSYASRVRDLCLRLQEEQLYAFAWAAMTARPPRFSWQDLAPDESGYARFVEGLRNHLSRFY